MPGWVLGYHRQWLRGDLLAGVTITAYLVPQVMAYAEVAGLPAASGLWGCVGALLLYGLLGTSRQLSVGPESTTALMTAAALASIPVASRSTFAAVLALLVAVICVVARIARLAVLAELLSRPVLTGYMAGIALIMVVSQLNNLTGVRITAEAVFPRIAALADQVRQIQVATLLVGLLTAAAMVI